MRKRVLVVCILFLAAENFGSIKGKVPATENYVLAFKDMAISEMKRTGVPASITLAQGMLESGCGTIKLAREANNHFGIKCKPEWTGKTISIAKNGAQECYRAYENAGESYKDHSDFLTSRDRYKFLFKLKRTDYTGWARGLKKAGYATNPKYPDLLISTIKKNNLNQYDKDLKTNGLK